MSLGTVLEEIDAHNRAAAALQTFGHLRVKPSVTHKGYFLFARATYDGNVIIADHFDTIPGSPWWYEAIHGQLDKVCADCEPGQVYRFDGTFREFKSGKRKFTGNVTKVA